jgi:uncharacterized protein YidB (DUF937 family)
MSGFFGQALGSLFGNSGSAAGLPGLLTQIVSGGEGGLPGLLQQLQSGGLGEQVKSWVGTGTNLPISAEQIAAAIPAERLQGWAEQIGVAPEALTGMLAQVLPHAVDQATPNGTVEPGAVAMPDLGALVGRLFGR